MKNYTAVSLIEGQRGTLVNGHVRLRELVQCLGEVVTTEHKEIRPKAGKSLVTLFLSELDLAGPAISAASHWRLRVPVLVAGTKLLHGRNIESFEQGLITIEIDHLPDTDNEHYIVRLTLPWKGSRRCESIAAARLTEKYGANCILRGLENIRVVVTLAKQDGRFEVDMTDVVRRLGTPEPEIVGANVVEIGVGPGGQSYVSVTLRQMPQYALQVGLADVMPPTDYVRKAGKFRGSRRYVGADRQGARVKGHLRPLNGEVGGYADPHLIIALVGTIVSERTGRWLPVTDPVDQREMRQVADQIVAAFKK